jgi:hypothetical protein
MEGPRNENGLCLSRRRRPTIMQKHKTHNRKALLAKGIHSSRPILEPIEARRHLAADVSGLWLVNAESDQPIMQLTDGMTLDLNSLETDKLNVRADANGETVSIRFDLGGSTYSVENSAPYALAGDRKGNYHAWTPAEGELLIAATPFTRVNARGEAGDTLELQVHVVRGAALQPPAAPTSLSGSESGGQILLAWQDASNNESGFQVQQKVDGAWATVATLAAGTTSHTLAAGSAGAYEFRVLAFNEAGPSAASNVAIVVVGEEESGPAVTGFVLVDAASDGDAFALVDGAILSLESLPSSLNIRADVEGEGIVRVDLSLSGAKATTRSENSAPYALFGGNGDDYHGSTLPAGSYTLSAVPILADGSRGAPLTISFTVTDTPDGGDGGGTDGGTDGGTGDSNTAPFADNDTATAGTGGVARLSVLDNDWDADGDSLAIVGTTNPANGRITVNSDGTVTYTANDSFTGTDKFTYRVGDGVATSNWATVTVTVPPNDGGGDPQVGERPGPENTGPSDPSLLRASGNVTVTSNWSGGGSGTVADPFIVENLDIDGSLNITVSNVIVRNFRVTSGARYPVQVNYDDVTNVTIQDGEVIGSVNSSTLVIVRHGATLRRLRLHESGGDAVKTQGNNVLMEGCWAYHLGMAEGAHADGVQIRKGMNLTFRGNFFDMPVNQSGYRSNAAFMIQVADGPIDGILIEGNWMNGGNYTIFSEGENVVIRDNFFGHDYRYGVVRVSGDGTTWENNRWWDTGEVIPR